MMFQDDPVTVLTESIGRHDSIYLVIMGALVLFIQTGSRVVGFIATQKLMWSNLIIGYTT